MKLDIFLRTYDGGDVRPDARPLEISSYSKQEILLRCVHSLIHSINKCDHKINLTVLDDHSSDSTLELINQIIDTYRINANIIHLKECSAVYSQLTCYEMAHDSKADFVYCVEDDYLHVTEAIQVMIDSAILFMKNTNSTIGIFPDDYDIFRDGAIPCRIVPGTDRSWRTNVNTTGTLFLSKGILQTHWKKFEKLCLEYPFDAVKNGYCITNDDAWEGTTIALIWQEGSFLFTPIIPLAVHLTPDITPFFNWITLWDKHNIDKLREDNEKI